MKIKLLLPSFYDEEGKLVKVRKTLIPNLTIPYLASMIPHGDSVSTTEECLEDINFSESVDLVGISVNTTNAERAYEIADEFKRREVTVVAGGIHATFFPHEASQHFDSVVIGEAEDSWPALIRDFKNGKLLNTYHSPRRDNLINFAHPRFDLLDHSKYARLPFNKSPIIPIQTSRGCPNNCDFCTVTQFWGRKLRYRPIEDILEEIKSCNSDTFFFTDDNFFSSYARTEELCKAIAPLKIKYICQMDTSIFQKPRLLRLAAKSGCIMCYIGFESFNKKNLKKINKNFNKPEDYERILRIFRKNNINVYASFIFGFDNDTPQSVIDTVDFLIKERTSISAFFPLCPFPKTALYERLKKNDRLVDNEWWLRKSKIGSDRIKYSGDQFTGIELSKMAMKRFYSYPSIFRRFFFPGKNRLLPLCINVSIHKKIKKSFASFM